MAYQNSKPCKIYQIMYLGIKNQILLSKSLDFGCMSIAREHIKIDKHLIRILKEAGQESSYYIWHTQADDKVRHEHAANDGHIFDQNNPPTTGNPGDDYGCRCWAEPVNGEEYVNQSLISKVNDGEQWSNLDFVKHYFKGVGVGVSLSEIGYLGSVIEHYSEALGKYEDVNQQIIAEAQNHIGGNFTYDFSNTYDFGGIFTGVSFSLGESTVSGSFTGNVRKEKNFLVINGIITYNFYDEFTDPGQLVEIFESLPGVDREDAIDLVGNYTDTFGASYIITDQWQTKFNASVKTKEEKFYEQNHMQIYKLEL